jgi:hypothetical protein
VASLESIASRFGLDADQTEWLRVRLAAGDLRRPDDLAGLPGAGSDLLLALEGAWCWGAPSLHDARIAASFSRRRRVETRLRLARGPLETDVRLLEASDRRVLRGAGALHRGGWRIRGGTLAVCRGLGLLMVTPGAEPREAGPRELRRGAWRTSTALDPRTLLGAAVAFERRALRIEIAQGREAEPPSTRPAYRAAMAAVQWSWPSGVLGVQAVREDGAWSQGIFAGGRRGAGTWSAELARAGEGIAAGASWRLAAGSWSVRAGLRREGAGYRAPGATSAADAEDQVVWDVETVWRGGPARFLRAAARSEREPETGAEWVRRQDRTLEAGERLRPGLTLVLTWRERSAAARPVAAAWRETVSRAELRIMDRPWGLRVRHEERRSGVGLARHTEVRVGRRGSVEWEGRAGFLSLEGDPPLVWGYARRAGGLYGWDALDAGARLGVWGGCTAGPLRVEASVDATPGAVRATASVGWRGGPRGTLDPPSGPS